MRSGCRDATGPRSMHAQGRDRRARRSGNAATREAPAGEEDQPGDKERERGHDRQRHRRLGIALRGLRALGIAVRRRRMRWSMPPDRPAARPSQPRRPRPPASSPLGVAAGKGAGAAVAARPGTPDAEAVWGAGGRRRGVRALELDGAGSVRGSILDRAGRRGEPGLHRSCRTRTGDREEPDVMRSPTRPSVARPVASGPDRGAGSGQPLDEATPAGRAKAGRVFGGQAIVAPPTRDRESGHRAADRRQVAGERGAPRKSRERRGGRLLGASEVAGIEGHDERGVRLGLGGGVCGTSGMVL